MNISYSNTSLENSFEPLKFNLNNYISSTNTNESLYKETQFSYFGARYYDANLGIWLSVDPLAAKYPSLSPYTYCANNPIMLVDPNGMNFDEWDFNMSSGEFTWKSNKGGDNTQHINIIGNKGNYGSSSLSISTSEFKDFIDNHQTYKSNNDGSSYGFSIDLTIAGGPFGFALEFGIINDSKDNWSPFISYGHAFGGEASFGVNAFVIPDKNFTIDKFEGSGTSLNINLPLVSLGGMTDRRQGALKDYLFNEYTGYKAGIGIGVGGSVTNSKTTFIEIPPISTELLNKPSKR